MATARSLTQIITYGAYHMADVYLNQPLQIVVGSVAVSKWMSDDLFDRAAEVAEAVGVLAPFFARPLAEVKVAEPV